MNAQPRLKKCPKCGQKKPLEEFGNNKDSEDGHTSYCKKCRNALGKRRREVNVAARLKHHIGTRVVSQLGPQCPINLVANLEEYLGYSIVQLTHHLQRDLSAREPGKSLKEVLRNGYHVDHIRPLSSFSVVLDHPASTHLGVDWQVFRECWAPENLRAIAAEENLKKGSSQSSRPNT